MRTGHRFYIKTLRVTRTGIIFRRHKALHLWIIVDEELLFSLKKLMVVHYEWLKSRTFVFKTVYTIGMEKICLLLI